MGKITKWSSDYPIDFELIGMVSTMKEYKMGWHLNQMGIFELAKGEDIEIEFADDKVIAISNLYAQKRISRPYICFAIGFQRKMRKEFSFFYLSSSSLITY